MDARRLLREKAGNPYPVAVRPMASYGWDVPRETSAARRERVDRILTGLRDAHPDAHCELVSRTPLELLVATVLSAQCTDKQVNRVTADLFQKYRTARDYADAAPEVLEADIRRIGLFRSKARNLRSACRILVEQHGGEVPRSLEALTALDGVGRKTANVVLGNAFGLNEGIVVDTHVSRLSQRLKLTTETDPVKIESALVKLVPREEWTVFSHRLIWHGRRRCFARNPDCAGCELRADCPSGLGPV